MQDHLMFAPLGMPQSRWKAFVVGWGIQAKFLLAILLVNILFPQRVQQTKKYLYTSLVAPVEFSGNKLQHVNPELQVKTKTIPIKVLEFSKLLVPRQAREIREPELDVKAPEIKLSSKKQDLPSLPNIPIPKVVATDTFANPTNLMPTTTKPASQVQTGGFGNRQGISPTGNGRHDVNITAKGNPGLPMGTGFGDGVGGGKGIVGAGIIGNSMRSSGFDNQYVFSAQKQAVIPTNEPGSPVQIIEKSKPSYTEEGRKRGVEGEVRLEVQFTADGHVRVLRVLQGLGFGLDEQASHCAEQIRFKPATHAGHPIDSTAVVHIVFELAS